MHIPRLERYPHPAIQEGVQRYVKIHVKTGQGIKNFTNSEAIAIQSSNPDHHTQDLYDAIESGDYPSWTFYVQSMDVKQAETYRWNVFDMTKVWPHADFPLREFGRLTLNRNPSNYFNDVEQAAFSPSLLVPGIAASADPGMKFYPALDFTH
jgi:catalase